MGVQTELVGERPCWQSWLVSSLLGDAVGYLLWRQTRRAESIPQAQPSQPQATTPPAEVFPQVTSGQKHVTKAPDKALVRALAGHSDVVFSVAFSPTGRTLASGNSDQTARTSILPPAKPAVAPAAGVDDATPRGGD